MICVALQENNVKRCLQIIEKVEMAEIRIDMAKLSIDDVKQIFRTSTKPLIATCRPEFCSDEVRMELLKTAIKAGAAFVDVEIESSEAFKQEMCEFTKAYNCKLIISYHNYDCTPDNETLQSLIKSSFKSGADIAKIAVMVQSVQDNARLLSLYDTEKAVVALGMGQLGKITRIVAPLFGSPFTFAALDDASATAPGQITYEKLKTIQNQISLL